MSLADVGVAIKAVLIARFALPSLNASWLACLGPLSDDVLLLLGEHFHQILLEVIPTFNEDAVQLLLRRHQVPIRGQPCSWQHACHPNRLEEGILLFDLPHGVDVSFTVVVYLNLGPNGAVSLERVLKESKKVGPLVVPRRIASGVVSDLVAGKAKHNPLVSDDDQILRHRG